MLKKLLFFAFTLSLFLPQQAALQLKADLFTSDPASRWAEVRVFPENRLLPMQKNILFVKKYPIADAKRYQGVISDIRSSGMAVTSPEVLSKTRLAANTKVISLGSPENDGFWLKEGEMSPRGAFVEWKKKHLGPFYTENLKIQFKKPSGGLIKAVDLDEGDMTAQGKRFIVQFPFGTSDLSLEASFSRGKQTFQQEISLSVNAIAGTISKGAITRTYYEKKVSSPFWRPVVQYAPFWIIGFILIALGLLSWLIFREREKLFWREKAPESAQDAIPVEYFMKKGPNERHER